MPRLFSAVLWDAEGFRLPTCVLFSAHAQAGFLPPTYVVRGGADLLSLFHFAILILLLFLSLLSLFHLYSYWTAGRSAFNFLYFLEMTIPPDVGFPFSYIKGHFACCPLLMV